MIDFKTKESQTNIKKKYYKESKGWISDQLETEVGSHPLDRWFTVVVGITLHKDTKERVKTLLFVMTKLIVLKIIFQKPFVLLVIT